MDQPEAASNSSNILTVNAGSSSIKLGVYTLNNPPERAFEAVIAEIGQPSSNFIVKGTWESDNLSKTVNAPDHQAATVILVDWLKQKVPSQNLAAIGHRIVHGGPKYYEPRLIDAELIAGLDELTLFDREHLPIEIQLINTFQKLFPNVKQVACFDTAFHHDLPNIAKFLAIPRQYQTIGIRRYGFHGLSIEYVLQELSRHKGPEVLNAKIIVAHLGNGVSLTATQGGKSLDTTMGLTPASGVPMSTRSGDLDPGLVLYLARNRGMDSEKFNNMVNFHSGLLGISETTSDMKQLLEHQTDDHRAKEAVELFCYQVKKSIGSLAAALGGLDRLIFTGGMGENAPKVRSKICENLEFLGINIDETSNSENTNEISTEASRVTVNVIHADEAAMIAQSTWQLTNHRSAE